MDKLTLTRQFGIQFRIFLGRYRDGIGMEYYRDSYRRKGSLLIQRCTYGIEEEEKTKISQSTFDRKIHLISFVPFAR